MGGFIALCTSLVEAVLRGATLGTLLHESPALWVVWSFPFVLAVASHEIASHRAARDRPVPWARPLPPPPIPVATLGPAPSPPEVQAPVAVVAAPAPLPRPQTIVDDGRGGFGGDERALALAEQVRVLKDQVERVASDARSRAQVLVALGPALRQDLSHLVAEVELAQIGPGAARVARELTGAVTQIVDLARLETGELRVDHEVVDLMPLIDDLRAWFAPLAAEQHTGFHARVEQAARHAQADPVGVRQILTVLLDHARRHTREGQIQLVVERATPRRDAWIAVHVRDTGEGMDDAELERVFTVEGAEARGGRIGLVIAHLVAERMGGRIDVVSDKGIGSTFTLMLPPVADPGRGARRSGVPLQERIRGLEVGVVSGGPAGAWLARQLEAAGLVPRPGAEAAARAPVVLVDADERGAWGCVEDLVIEGRRVILTVVRDEDAERGRSLGVRAILFRPLDLRLLLATIDRCAEPLPEPVGAHR